MIKIGSVIIIDHLPFVCSTYTCEGQTKGESFVQQTLNVMGGGDMSSGHG